MTGLKRRYKEHMYERRTPMWAETTKDGKVKFREQYKDPLTGKYKKVSVTYDKNTNQTRRRAQIALEQKIQSKLRNIQDGNIKKNVTLGEVIREWEPVYKKQVLSGTYYSWSTYKKIIKDKIGFDVLINKITSKYLINLYEDMLYKEDYKRGTIIQLKAKINHIMKYAYQHDYISTLPTANLEINWPRERKKSEIEEKFLENDELRKVIDYLEHLQSPNHHLYASLCEWMVLTGMRFGEATTIQVKNVYKANNKYFVEICGTLVYKGLKSKKQFKSPLTKTNDSQRTILLPKKAVAIYKEFSKGKRDSDFMFALSNHNFVSIDNINYFLRKAKKKLKIPKTISTHTFRHTHVSQLAELGVPLYIIQKRLGHSDSEITSKVYLHVTKKAQKKYDNIIESL